MIKKKKILISESLPGWPARLRIRSGMPSVSARRRTASDLSDHVQRYEPGTLSFLPP